MLSACAASIRASSNPAYSSPATCLTVIHQGEEYRPDVFEEGGSPLSPMPVGSIDQPESDPVAQAGRGERGRWRLAWDGALAPATGGHQETDID